MAGGGQQVALLLWKDFLIRKRKLITLGGVVWAIVVMLSLYIVRVNVDNHDYPHCSYPARALPSAGMLTFLQSFVCSVNNECSPLDEYQEIPTYENSKLTQLQRRFAPFLTNESVLGAARAAPPALRLVATLARAADEPTFADIARNGLTPKDLFDDPKKVQSYLSKKLGLEEKLIEEVMLSQLSFQGILTHSLDKCSEKSLSQTFRMNNTDALQILVSKICPMADDELQKILMEIMPNINFSKYVKMLGTMYSKLNGDNRLMELGDTLTAVLRMTKISSFIPTEIIPIFSSLVADYQQKGFSYYNLTIINKLMDLFEPTFGETESYKNLRGLTDTVVTTLQWLYKVITKGQLRNPIQEVTSLAVKGIDNNEADEQFHKLSEDFNDAIDALEEDLDADTSVDKVLGMLSNVANLIVKWLPKKTQHDFLFYSTLLAKLMESTNRVVVTNVNIEEIVYKVSQRNSAGIRILVELPPHTVGKIFDALTDAGRAQVLTSKINHPGQVFCDVNKLSVFFVVSQEEAKNLKSTLCKQEWKNFMTDLIKSFGVFDVKANINEMASLLVQETIGRDTSEQLYSVDKDFQVLKGFINTMMQMKKKKQDKLDWRRVLNVTKDSEFSRVVEKKASLKNQILIVLHGALANEVVKQNPILEAKISPVLIDTTEILTALNVQLESTPKKLVDEIKDTYHDILKMMLLTLLNEEKTYKSLSTHGTEIFCNNTELPHYLEFPNGTSEQHIIKICCSTFTEIDKALNTDSSLGKMVKRIMTTNRNPLEDINWNQLINSLRNLYKILENDYPYIFELFSYGMNSEQRAEIAKLVDETKAFWFGRRTLSRSMHLSIKVALNGFDLVDKEIFNLTSITWQQIKQGSDSLNGLFVITDEIVKLITAIAKQNSYNSDKIPIMTLMALKEILPNIPHLIVESTDIFIQDNIDIDEVVNILNADPSWPCSEKSLSKILNMSSKPAAAVKGMETILCMNRSLQTEWLEYTEAQKVRMIMSMKNLSRTEYEPHLFLKLSKNFDALVKDVDRMKEILQEIINENVTKEISKDNPTFKLAIEYSLRVIKGSDNNATFIKFLRKADKVFESTKTPSEFDGMSPHALWESYLKCSNVSYMDANCKLVSRATWLFTLKFFSVALNDVAQVVSNYFSEVSGPNATIIQILGFNRNTGLYILYEKMAGFIGVLLNSYWDLGFLNQIRRASKSMFWDCQAIVDAMVIPPGSLVTSEDIRKVKPYVCPSILYWISLPRGENSFLDIVAKPQNYFYNTPVQNLTSSFESAYVNTMELSNSIANLTKANRTDIDKQLTKIEDQFENFVDQVLSWHVSEHDPSFRLFAEINRKQFVSTIYLTRVTVTVKKLADEMDVLKISDISDNLTVNETKKLESELSAIQRLFRRRPADVIALHFDLITDLLWKNDEGYQLVDSVVTMCGNLENNVTSYILGEDKRTKTQICSKNYELIYAKVQDELSDVIHMSKNALINLVDVLRYDEEDVSSIDPFAYINKRTKVVKALQHLVKHADDLGLALYVKYLQSILDHYNVVLSYLTGEDWWDALRKLYHGRYADSFFETLAKSFEIAEDILMHFDKIRIVRLLRDVNFNDTATFCQNNITLSEYLPDSTGYLSLMKQQLCAEDKIELFRELPLLTLASQGYDNELKLPKYVNYTVINEVINELQSRLDRLKEGPKTPLNPPWIQERPQQLKQTMLKLFSKESLTKVAFGLIGNIVDASTLFLNSSHCDLCSSFTTWFKQLNLQLFKKQEYDNLLCHLHEMAPEEIYQSLKNDFHWDMALKELISTRNYTKYELNKSINDFLEQVKLHLLEDISSQSLKLADCLANGISRNVLGNVTLFTSLISKSLQLVRVAMPHVHEVEGIKSVSFFERLSKEVAPRLRVAVPLKSVLIDESEFIKKIEEVDNGLPKVFEGASIDMPDTKAELQNQLRFVNDDWKDICNANNCTRILSIIRENLNKTASAQLFSRLQMEKFWKFDFIVDILRHLENFLSHLSRLLGVASDVDLVGLYKGRIDAHLDFILQVLQQDTTNVIQESLQGMITELHPLLDETPLQFDLNALSNGLRALMQFKSSLITNGYFKIGVEELFVSEEKIESRMNSMGINNTNFWSIAAPRIGVGYIDIKPLLNAKTKNVHIRNFVCQTEEMAKVIHPANVDVVTLDDVYGAVVEQFCDVSDRQARQIIPILIENLNFTFLVDKVMNAIKTELFLASNLTTEEGESVFSKYGQLMSLMPTLQENIGDIADTLFKEPLFSALKNYGSLNGLLSSSEFLASAGNMICGQPFVGNSNKFYKAIAETRDFSTGVDPLQIEVLPTDFCRSLYKDVLSMSGGKIVWSFIKPLIMGQILYTPAAPAVQAIIQKANSSFALMSELADIVHSFAGSFDAVESIAEHKDSVGVLRTLMNSANFREMLKAMTGGDGASTEANVPNVNIDEVFESFGDIKDIGNFLRRASDLLRCVNLNRFHAMPSEDQLSHEAVKLTRVNEFAAGLVFTETEMHGDSPVEVEYKIRMDIDSVPTTTRKRNQFWTPGPEASFLEDMRYFRGFVQIQDMIDKAIIELSANLSKKIVKRDVTSIKDNKWAVYTQQVPYPCYRRDYFQSSLYESQALIVALFFSLMLTVSSAIRFIVSEKEAGITMLLSVMGVSFRNQALSWFVATFVEMVVTVTGMLAALKLGGVLPHSDPSLLWLIMLNFGLSVVMFCYLMSKFFKSSSLGAVCVVLVYLVSFMPYVIILALEAALTETEKVVTSLSMSTAFCYSILYVARYEAVGAGAHWHNVWNSPTAGDRMSIASTSIIVLFDSILYFVIACLIDKFFGPKTLKSNINKCTTTSEKAGVSIIGITKVYAEKSRRPKVALDNVSIELHKGQITTLLGHNGAGKTTLIKIITGMLKPSKGHVIVRAESGDGGATRLGVCPQHDVLFENMTTVEHLTLYARLKSGLPLGDVKSEIQNMLKLLSFGVLAYEQARRLSGGLRRRLCVALAFVAQPQLVLLDEPSSGVDPLARRDIWSLIVRLKEDRTVLLTTHHLDEAELLSDQIVIVHRGQIHTVGSPVEIKRSLGNGYKLTVTYPRKVPSDMQTPERYDVWNEELDRTVSVEERSKRLVGAVAGAVRNARVEDVDRFQVVMLIPFFDADGLNNDLLHLCTVLESRQEELGFSSYNLDCSSLEQVFFNICQQADRAAEGAADGETAGQINEAYDTMSSSSSRGIPSKSTSTASLKNDNAPLVPDEGQIRGTGWEQFLTLLHKRWIHYSRNTWLLFLLLALPTLFVAIAMGFSLIRPPADNEIALKLDPDLYHGSTEFLIPTPTTYDDNTDPAFAENVMSILTEGSSATNWSAKDSPVCRCTELRQECDYTEYNEVLPKMLLLPNTSILNDWLIKTQEIYIEKRYGGWSSSLKNNISNFVAWYNNKGHHAMPSYVNSLNSAVLRAVSGGGARITTYTHPLKISEEQLSKSTVLQHVADAGIAGMLLLAVSLVPAGGAVYLVLERTSQQKRLQLLSGVTPAVYWAATLTWDMIIMLVNVGLTCAVLLAFGLPVFVARENLPAICLLLFLFGFSCSSLVHVLEKLFTEASMANMILFCGNVFLGLSGLALLLILDIISESEATDNARWTLHKVFLLSPQFALGDALLEIAKNTVQAQVLSRFGMDTYKNPFETDLILYHCVALVLVGLFMLLLNLAIEYNCFDHWICSWRNRAVLNVEMEDLEVAAERKRVEASARDRDRPVTLHTIGNINAGFVDTESKKGSIKQIVSPMCDVAQCVGLGRTYRGVTSRIALKSLYLGIPPGQCTALLGQNGAGKSTTFALLSGELRATCGRVVLNGSAVTSRQICSGLISYCPQSDALDPLLTVTQTLQFYCRLRGIADVNEVVKRTLQTFDLRKYSRQRCGTLSGGNRRKLCTAVAFMGRAPLVLLDEPTSGMDPGSRWCVARGVRAACAARRGVLLSTHALEDARVLASRVALLRDGALCALAPLDQCLQRFGSGHVVSARAERGGAARLWLEVRARAPQAQLQAMHHNTLQFLVPTKANVEGKEVVTQLSDVFRLLAALQGTAELDDYTLNASSLDQMFLNFSDRSDRTITADEPPMSARRNSDQLESVTAL